MIISVAGPSCSGKTTLCKKLAAETGASLMHLDLYWIEGSMKPEVFGIPSREQPHQYNGSAMAEDAVAAKEHNRDIILEGFLTLTYPEIVKISDIMFYIDVPHEILKQRRTARTENGGNPVWNTARNNEDSIDKGWLLHGEHEWTVWGMPQQHVAAVVTLNGTLPLDEMFVQTMNIIKKNSAE